MWHMYCSNPWFCCTHIAHAILSLRYAASMPTICTRCRALPPGSLDMRWCSSQHEHFGARPQDALAPAAQASSRSELARIVVRSTSSNALSAV